MDADLLRLCQHGGESIERLIALRHRHKAEPQPEDPRLVTGPGAIGDPHPSLGGYVVETIDGRIIEYGGLQPYAAKRTRIGSHPCDKAAIFVHPIRRSAQSLRELPAPLGNDAVAPQENLERQRLVDRRAANDRIELADDQLPAK